MDFDLSIIFNGIEYSVDISYVLLITSIVLILFVLTIPSSWRPLIKVYSENVILAIKSIFWILIAGLIIFNFFMYFIQPDYHSINIGVERQQKDVIIRLIDKPESYRFSYNLFQFIKDSPDDKYFMKYTIWIWNNMFYLNNN